MRSFVAIVAALAATFAFAEPNRTITGAKIKSAPKIDGQILADEWSGASVSSQFVHIATGEKTPFDATVYLAYDETNVYIAFDCPDPSPGSIRATEYRRGVDLDGDDRVIVLINPFSTNQHNDINEFTLSAGGGLQAEFAGGRSAKREWEGAWDGKSRITERGWEGELVVPWRVLRLPNAGVKNLEVNFARVIPRDQLALAWCDIGPQEQMHRNGSWLAVEVPKVKLAQEVLLLPYQIVGYNQEKSEHIFDSGVDIRYNVNQQVSSLMTVNPDFRNVEGAVLNLSFSRFERLAEERRPFFVEGQDEFRLGGMSASMFAPQRIRAFDVGVKAFGKIGDNSSFGAMVTSRFDHETAAIARYRQTWGKKSYLNAGLVHWDDRQSGLTNTAKSMELIHWIGNWGGDIIYSATDDSEVGKGRRVDLDLMYQDNATFLSIGKQTITEGLLPRIGFAPQTGFEGMNAFLFHNKEMPTGALSEYRVEGSYYDTDREDGKGVYLRMLNLEFGVVTRGNLEVEIAHERSNYQGDRADLWGIDLTYPENDPYKNIGIGVIGGEVDDEKYTLFGVSGNYRFSNRISVAPALQFEKSGKERSTLHIVGVGYELDKNRSLAGRVVIRDGEANWYLAYRHSGNIGTEWYVILGDPNAESFQRKIIVKAVFPVSLKF